MAKTRQDLVLLTKKLINIDTSKKKNLGKALSSVTDWARDNDLKVTRVKNTRAILIETNPKAKHHLSFLTHIDVVPAGEWKQAFKAVEKKGFIYGRGSVDDKGPLVVCLETLKSVKAKNQVNVSCLIVSDEETTNKDINTILKAKDYRPDFCIVADGGENNIFDVGQKGNLSFSVTIETKGGHSAFEQHGHNAANELAWFINQLQEFAKLQLSHHQFTPSFVNVSEIETKELPYSMPSLARVRAQVCLSPPQKSKNWLIKIKSLKKRLQKRKAKVVIDVTWTTEPHILEDEKWLKLIQASSKIKAITSGGNNLAKDLVQAGILAVSHCPTRQYMAHCHNERIAIADLVKGVKLYSTLVKRFEQTFASKVK